VASHWLGTFLSALHDLLDCRRRFDNAPVSVMSDGLGSPCSNQIEFSLLRNLPKTGGLIDACNKIGVATLAYSPLGTPSPTRPPCARPRAPRQADASQDAGRRISQTVMSL